MEGCVHLHIKDGKIRNVFCHLSDLPENGVVHLFPSDVMTEDEFITSHLTDKNELSISQEDRIFNLGSSNIELF